jgi:hypothetical protein
MSRRRRNTYKIRRRGIQMSERRKTKAKKGAVEEERKTIKRGKEEKVGRE